MLYESAWVRLESVDGIATLWLDPSDGGCASITVPLLREIDRALDVLQQGVLPDILAIRSVVPGVFLDGPESVVYDSLATDSHRRSFADLGQRIAVRLEELRGQTDTVAVIEGLCRNGGLELALACEYRVAVAGSQTRIGVDYLNRGRLPCWGLTQRLPQILGAVRSLEFIEKNEMVSARAARSLGLVDAAFGSRAAKTELWWFLAELQDGSRPTRPARSLRARFRDWVQSRRSTRTSNQSLASLMSFGGSIEGYLKEREMFVGDAVDQAALQLRHRARVRDQRIQKLRPLPAPKLVGFVGLGDASLDLLVRTVVGGMSATVCGPIDGPSLAAAMQSAVDEGWMTRLEADRALASSRSDRLLESDLIIWDGKSELPPGLSDATPILILGDSAEAPGDHVRLTPFSSQAIGVAGKAGVDPACRWLEACHLEPILSESAELQVAPSSLAKAS